MIRLPLAVLLLAAAPALFAQGMPQWKIYEFAEYKFRALFPEGPAEKKGRLKTEIGEVVSARYTADGGDATYDVTVTDYPPERVGKINPDKVINSARDGLVEHAKGTLESSKASTMGHARIRDCVIVGSDGTRYRVKLTLIGTRLYQVTAMAKPPAKAEEDKFLSSFQLIGSGTR